MTYNPSSQGYPPIGAGHDFPSSMNTSMNMASMNPIINQQPSSSQEIIRDQTFMDLVRSEMVTILHKLFADIKAPQPMSLDEVAVANPALFAQIRANAEESAREIILARQNFPQPMMGAIPGMMDHAPLHHPSQQQSMAVSNNKKRTLERPTRFGDYNQPDNIIIPSDEPSMMAGSGDTSGRVVNGFVGETVVCVDLDQVQRIKESIRSQGMEKLALRLEHLLGSVHQPPSLPSILFGKEM